MASSQQQLTDFSVIPSKQSYFPPAIVALSHVCARSGQERSTFIDPETTRLNQKAPSYHTECTRPFCVAVVMPAHGLSALHNREIEDTGSPGFIFLELGRDTSITCLESPCSARVRLVECARFPYYFIGNCVIHGSAGGFIVVYAKIVS